MLLSSATQLAATMLQIRSVPSYFYVYTYCLVKRSSPFTTLSRGVFGNICFPQPSYSRLALHRPTPPLFFGSQPDIEKKRTFAPFPSSSLRPKHNYLYFLSFSPLASPTPFHSSLEFFFCARNPMLYSFFLINFTSLLQLIKAIEWAGG
jgi:hypothetical protein